MGRRLILTLPAGLFAGLIAVACWINLTRPALVDFISFWHASGLILQGKAAAVYAIQPSWVGELMPLAYPPPFLLFIAPLGLASLGVAFTLWVAVTGLFYVLASRAGFRLALANPAAAYTGMVGQNGFLTAAIMLQAAHWLRSRPLLGGALFGLMIIKPQLALLVPLALAAGGYWRAFLAAAVSSITLLVLAALVFGLDAYRGAFDVMPQYAAFLEQGRWPWNQLASVFAFMRWLGASRSMALAVHAAVAVFAAAMVWRAWRQDWEAKVPVLAAAALLISPYLFSYDAPLLIAPLAWLAARRPAVAAAVWILALPPLFASFGLYSGPNTLPIAVLVSLLALRYKAEPAEL